MILFERLFSLIITILCIILFCLSIFLSPIIYLCIGKDKLFEYIEWILYNIDNRE